MEKEESNGVCEDCGRIMSPRNGCLCSHIVIDEQKYERIKYGATSGFDDDMPEGHVCHDCNVAAGQYHHFGCDMERCPKCHFQLLGCDCVLEAKNISLIREK